MGPAVSLVSISLATVCAESSLFGIFTVLFICSTYILARRRYQATKQQKERSRTSDILHSLNSPFILSSVILAAVITGHWLLTCIRLFQAFVPQHGSSDPLSFYANLRAETEVVKTVLLVASVVLSDATLIYRLWLVWGKRTFIIIIPVLTLIGVLILGVAINIQIATFRPTEDIFHRVFRRWIITNSCFTLITNIYCTTGIIWRLSRVNNKMKQERTYNIKTILAIFVESAALYTFWEIFYTIAYETHSNMQFLVVDCLPAVAGISATLINVRVELHHYIKSSIKPIAESSIHFGPLGTTMQSENAGNSLCRSLVTVRSERQRASGFQDRGCDPIGQLGEQISTWDRV